MLASLDASDFRLLTALGASETEERNRESAVMLGACLSQTHPR